jgi:hypothetical protein
MFGTAARFFKRLGEFIYEAREECQIMAQQRRTIADRLHRVG